jgi:hypothetical protein
MVYPSKMNHANLQLRTKKFKLLKLTRQFNLFETVNAFPMFCTMTNLSLDIMDCHFSILCLCLSNIGYCVYVITELDCR